MLVCAKGFKGSVLTKRLRGIWHAWHFWFAVGLVLKALCGSFGVACRHPLTARYIFIIHIKE
nr:DUF3265 domain-containing protein [Vibrio sp. STUT-A11]